MSETGVNPRAEGSAISVISLIREYTDKVSKAKTELRLLQAEELEEKGKSVVGRDIRRQQIEADKRFISDWSMQMDVSFDELIRICSQLIEHGDIVFSTRIELRIRLAEFEAYRNALRQVMYF